MVAFETGDSHFRIYDPENEANYVRLSMDDLSLYPNGIVVGNDTDGGKMEIGADGSVSSLKLRELNTEQIASVPVGHLYMHGGEVYFKKAAGTYCVTN